MNAETIDGLVKSLGKTYDALIMDGLIPNQSLQALYEGRDRLHMELVPGISLSFWAETRRLEALFITLTKSTPSTVEYRGELPKPFSSVMTKSDIRSEFGEPMQTSGPIKMPQPLGMTGGWDAYPLEPSRYPNTKLIFKYEATMRVKALLFTLVDKGHD